MNMTLMAFVLWLVVLIGLTFLFWLRPRSFFSGPDVASSEGESVSIMASLLAVLLFISCFLFGLWIGLAELKGVL